MSDSFPELRPGLAFGPRLVVSGAACDVLLEAMKQGLLSPGDLNTPGEGKPPIQCWVEGNRPRATAVELAESSGHTPDMAWPVDTDPLAVPFRPQEGWDGRGVWVEHTLVRLVQGGLDPLQPWAHSTKHTGQPENLLEWASATGLPWLLRACLESLGKDRAFAQAQRRCQTDGDSSGPLPRLHAALATVGPLIAEVWRTAGAPACATENGETPLFFARTPAAVAWALKTEGKEALASKNAANETPVQTWRRYADVADWGVMQEQARAAQESIGAKKQITAAVLQNAIDRCDAEGTRVCMKSYGPADLLPNGHTPLGHAARRALKEWSPSNRSAHRTMEACKILASLWPLTDLDAAAAAAPDGFSDLGAAIIASEQLERIAAKGLERARRKHPEMVNPSLERAQNWGQVLLAQDAQNSLPGAYIQLRRWVAEKTAELARTDPNAALNQLVLFARNTRPEVDGRNYSYLRHCVQALLEAHTAARQPSAVRVCPATLLEASMRLLAYAARWEGSSGVLDMQEYVAMGKETPRDHNQNSYSTPYLIGIVCGAVDLGGQLEPAILHAVLREIDHPDTQANEHIQAANPILKKLLFEGVFSAPTPKPARPRM